MCRGQLNRQLRISEIGLEEIMGECLGRTIQIEGQSSSSTTRAPAYALRLTTKQGKTNKFGRPVSVGIYRHKEIELCAFSAFGLYFFWRFHIAGEEVPDFTRKETWYNRYLLIGRIYFKQNTYQIINLIRLSANQSKKVTHAKMTLI